MKDPTREEVKEALRVMLHAMNRVADTFTDMRDHLAKGLETDDFLDDETWLTDFMVRMQLGQVAIDSFGDIMLETVKSMQQGE